MTFERQRLDSICSLIVDCPHSTPVWTESGYIVLRNQNIKNGRLDLSSPSFTDQAHFIARNRRAKPAAGDIVITREAPMGEVCMIPEGLECCLGQRQVLLRPDTTRVNGRYVFYAMQSQDVQHQIGWNEGTGSTVSNLRIPVLKSLQIPIPSRVEQNVIAHILGTLDDKIELNRRMSETLEAMARALFKAWFVDFEPVRAKMEGRWRRGETLPGLPAHLYDLFPDRLVESELGEIPEGWEVSELGGFVETIKGRSYKSEELTESTTALVTLKSFARGGGYRTDGLKPFTGKHKPEQIIEPGEVVVACTDVTQAAELVGRAAIVRKSRKYQTLVASLDTMIVRPRSDRITRSFLYHLGRSDAFVAHTYSHTTGTTVLHLGKDAIPTYRFALPPKDLVHQFDVIASNALSRIDTLEEESERLTTLRDVLLPKLISGELRIADAEAFLKGRG